MRVSKGDTGTFRLWCYASPGVPHNLSGAVIVTKIPGENGTIVELPNENVTILDQDDPATAGAYDVTFDAEDSNAFKETPVDGPKSDVTSTVTQGEGNASVITFHGYNILQVDPDGPRI